MQTENKKKAKRSMEELIKEKEYKIQQEKNQLKILKQKQSEENRKKRNHRLIERWFGIDLSIEIDKAIKRGEKPSVIAQLKKFKEQQKKAEQYIIR